MDAYSLGQVLREARERKALDIADIVAKLRIRQSMLEQFEAGDFDISGVPEIQVRGLLRIYARHLALDEEHILHLYGQMRLAQEKDRRGRRGRRRQPEAREEPFSSTQPLQEYEQLDKRATGCRGWLRRLLLLLFSAAAVAVIVFVTVELLGAEAFLAASQTPEASSAAPTDTVEAPPSQTPLSSNPTLPPGRAQYDGAGILVSLLLTQPSWLSLQSDGSIVYEGIAAAGTLLEYSAETDILLSAANALALDLIWNGQRQGVIGERGQRVEMRFTLESVVITLGPGGEPTAGPPTVAAETVTEEGAPEAAQSLVTPMPAPATTTAPTMLPTPLPTVTPPPTDSPQPSAATTATEPPEPTAILPPRVTQTGLPPTKAGA